MTAAEQAEMRAHLSQYSWKQVSGSPSSESTSQGSKSRSLLKDWQATPMPAIAALTSLSRTSEFGS